MAILITEIYRSSNGDSWKLVRNDDPPATFVRHEPNPSSGGRTTDTNVADFLSVDGSGPEYAALRLILQKPAQPTMVGEPYG